ncbi:hypothetical protein GIB67_018342 [Kingdonia uniflora]|uniref:Pentatricopeptide repeat-containing protein n=1 Tax=Kingdonia uniflora TaxID=39325 RepID=A0A7J7MJ02_9MAGN|nr:hypothetical protein GIB67_018342 [Kingdonia uniflora]
MPQRQTRAVKNCKKIHAQSVKFGFGLKGHLGNAILDLYSKCGDVGFARMTFERLDMRDVFAWNSIFSLYSKWGPVEEIVGVYGLMRDSNTRPNQFTFALVLSACGRLNDFSLGRQVHCNVIKMGLGLNSFCEGSLIDFYAKCDYIIDARRVFDLAVDLDTVSWTSMIAGYVRVGLPEEALKLFKDMQRMGNKPDQVVFVTVITACVGLGRLDEALDFFTKMENPNVVAWNVMISGYAQSDNFLEAIDFFRNMRVNNVKPTRSTLGSVLSAIANQNDLDQGERVHSEAIRLGLHFNVYVGSALINMYSKCKVIESARKMFDSLDEKNIVTWNAILGAYAQNNYYGEVMEIFSYMRSCGIKADDFTYTSILSACACLENVYVGKQLHSFIIKCNLETNLFVGNAMVDMYAKSGNLKDARKLFELIQNRDNISWNAIIVGYAQYEDVYEALNMFRRMIFDGISPDEVSLSSILSNCANLEALDQGKEVHCFSIRSGFDLNIYAGSSLVDMYVKCGAMDAAKRTLARMPEKSVVSRNALIAGYVQNNHNEKAITLFNEIQTEGLNPSKITFASILTACSGSSRMNFGKQVHSYALKSGILFEDDFLVVSLLKTLSIEDANKLFLEFPTKKSRILWTAIISGHTQNGYSKEALWFFREMCRDELLPDQAAFTIVLSACAGLASLKEGIEIHCLIIQTGFDLDEYTCSSLLDMYAKCGDMRSSVQVFEEMGRKEDVISWNSMIVGFAKNGYAEDALRIFHEMKQTCIKPDNITFLGVLTACSHAGMVSEGREFFDYMVNYHGMQPRADHYACLIDLLGRGGYLKEAEELIDDLPYQILSDSMIWATFLGACRVHGDDLRGKRAAQELIMLEPLDSSPYVLLSNMHALSRDWDAVNSVRKSMRERGVVKFPGCSWIVVGTKTNLFVAGDKSHPCAGEIWAVLKHLTTLITDHGYVPNVHSCDLVDED